MNIEEKLRGALDTPAPPPTTTLDHVLRRGRRRVFAQRAGAVLGVFAVVAGIGVGATTLNLAAPQSPAGGGDPDLGPAVVVHNLDWPRVNLPRRTLLDPKSPEIACGGWRAPTVGKERLSNDKMRAWRSRIADLVPSALVDSSLVEDVADVFKVEIRDSVGAGTVRLAVGSFTGSPVAAADDAVWAAGTCDPPLRSVDSDGTVYQLNDARTNVPEQSTIQVLYVFRPDGKVFRVEQLNAGVNSAGRVTRPTLPLTEAEFASLGPAIAGVA
ncbi:hypothetical protein UK23_19980 [Lentzea aerocolonigenes]|uniref:Uncharacterized protein n=1 Tax=Lentzea aerocolonigenes TaxID=68170 RepID=A0A0F0GVU9_LENAE|nr:hypothetical protein [Lentzea aerocolonigenes]KJK47584.1 hypothetical protein UK23_19980 [Lentzea aerocolonigenes]